MPDAGCRMPDAGCQLSAAGKYLKAAGNQLTDDGFQMTDIGYCQSSPARQMMPNRIPAPNTTSEVSAAHSTTNLVWSPNSTFAMPTRTYTAGTSGLDMCSGWPTSEARAISR